MSDTNPPPSEPRLRNTHALNLLLIQTQILGALLSFVSHPADVQRAKRTAEELSRAFVAVCGAEIGMYEMAVLQLAASAILVSPRANGATALENRALFRRAFETVDFVPRGDSFDLLSYALHFGSQKDLRTAIVSHCSTKGIDMPDDPPPDSKLAAWHQRGELAMANLLDTITRSGRWPE